MLFPALFRALRRSPQGAVRARRPGFHPRLEALEDRCVPSTFNVISSADSIASGTLRWAVAHAQNGDTINIQPFVFSHGPGNPVTVAQDIVLTQGELFLAHNVTIEAVGPQATISGDNLSRVFEVGPSVSVTLQNLDVTGGNGVANNPSSDLRFLDGNGGGIVNEGTLVVINSSVSGNSAKADGGGIANVVQWTSGTLYLIGSTVSGNSAKPAGGGVWNAGTLNVIGGSIAGNSTTSSPSTAGSGGGICNVAPGSTTVIGCTLSSNSASGYASVGGAIFNGGTLAVYNSTFSSNSAGYGGGGICNGSSAYVQGCTLSGNYVYGGTNPASYGVASEGGGIINGGTMQVVNSELLGNYAGLPGVWEGWGGGIANEDGSLTVSGCTLSKNIAYSGVYLSSAYSSPAFGGGIYNDGFYSVLTVTGSTLSYNVASSGAGICNVIAVLDVGSSTFVGNFPDTVVNYQGWFFNEGGNTGL